jgi:hypothetical protein
MSGYAKLKRQDATPVFLAFWFRRDHTFATFLKHFKQEDVRVRMLTLSA